MWQQYKFKLKPKKRGFHLIDAEINQQLTQIKTIKIGLLHLFIQHTSASLTINENADPSVRVDFESHFNRLAPQDAPYYTHTDEGPDDMPAHLKASTLGTELTLPITDGCINLGVWQGIYLGEHRDHADARTIIATIQGD